LRKLKNLAKYYYENFIEETIYQDMVVSRCDRNSVIEPISQTAPAALVTLTGVLG
jgi:imidazole glycerol phosphate synthase subunit HisF